MACENLECMEELWDNIRALRLGPLSAVLCFLEDMIVMRPPGFLLLRVMSGYRFEGRHGSMSGCSAVD